MMRAKATVRRAVRTLANRNIDWNAPVFQNNPELVAKMNNFRAWAASAESLAKKYDAPPSKIDFASAKEDVRDTSLINALESMYTSYTPPPEVHEWDPEERA